MALQLRRRAEVPTRRSVSRPSTHWSKRSVEPMALQLRRSALAPNGDTSVIAAVPRSPGPSPYVGVLPRTIGPLASWRSRRAWGLWGRGGP